MFATEDIEPGEFIVEYVGEFLTAAAGEDRECQNPSVFRFFFTFAGKKYWFVKTILPECLLQHQLSRTTQLLLPFLLCYHSYVHG